MSAVEEARAELLELVQSARALLQFHREAGSVGFPEGVGYQPGMGAPIDEAAWAASRAPGQGSIDEHVPFAPLPTAPAQPPQRVMPTLAPLSPMAAPQRAPFEPQRAMQPPPSPGSADARAQLLGLAQHVSQCTACELHQTRQQTVFARGNPLSELCFVGEGPGADEDMHGEPFVGKAGQLLDRMIAAMGYGRDDVYICYVVRCRPPQNRVPTNEEIAACAPFLNEQLSLVSPKVIVALGATASRALLGSTINIRSLRGQWKLYRSSIPVMPTFHPAYLLRDPSAKREVWQDLQSVLARLGRPVPGRGT